MSSELRPGQFVTFNLRVAYQFSDQTPNSPEYDAVAGKLLDVALGNNKVSKSTVSNWNRKLIQLDQTRKRYAKPVYKLLPRPRITQLFHRKETVADLNRLVSTHMAGLVPVFTENSLQRVSKRRDMLRSEQARSVIQFTLTYRCKLKGDRTRTVNELFRSANAKLVAGAVELPFMSSLGRGQFSPWWVTVAA